MIANYLQETFGHMECNFYCQDTGEDTIIANRLHQVLHFIPENEDFFLINSDTIFDFDIDAMHKKHKEERALVTLASVEVISSWGIIQMRGDRMVGFDRDRKIRHIAAEDDSKVQGRIYSGLAFINKSCLQYVDLTAHINFENILYRTVIAAGRASHFDIQGIWFPIDTPKDLDVINMVVHDINNIGNVARIVHKTLSDIVA